MNQNNIQITAHPDEHLAAVGDLLTQLRTHLTASADKKGTYGDYIRLLEFYRETSDEQVREITVRWIDHDAVETQPQESLS